MKKEFITYSEAFKMQVVEEISQGKFATILQAQKAYGICGMNTIRNWIKKYGKEELLPKRVRVETMEEIDELKEAKKRIRDLEKALSDAHMDYCLERAFLEIACEQMGTSREDLKKNNAIRLADARRRSRMKRA
jgi:transposase